LPQIFELAESRERQLDAAEVEEESAFRSALRRLSETCDFIVIDSPGGDSHLSRLAHAYADTLVTPLNDSFVDFDVLGTVDPTTFAVTGHSQYAEMVSETRRHRRLIDGALPDWVVVRNRLSMLGSRNRRLVGEGLEELSLRLGFRFTDGFAERVIYREFFPRGLTALDDLDENTLGTRPNMSHVTAREEVMQLLGQLRLPLDERGQKRAAARAEWRTASTQPLEVHDLLA
jgi:chromosome partitioning protein